MIKKNLKNISFNLGLVIGSTISAIFLIEIILINFGSYQHLVKTELTPSISVYERPSNSYQKQKHPDLNYINTHYFDSDGVKNDSPESKLASKQTNIIGFFGDSMIENVFVDNKFNFVNLLNSKIISENVSYNFGVGGYSLDQTFLRYLKYSDYKFSYVFCYINPGDHVTRNILKFDQKGNFEIVKPSFSVFQKIISKLNISYFLIDIFYKVRAEVYENHTEIDKSNYNQVLASRFYRKKYNLSKENNTEFINILKAFKSEVEKNDAKFFILLYPETRLVNFFENEIKKNKLKLDYFILDNDLLNNKNYRFKNDGHWNEYGNVKLAKNLIKILEGYSVNFIDDDFINVHNQINNLYKIIK